MAAAVCMSAQTANVTVRLIDPAGSPVARAAIMLTSTVGEKTKSVTRDDGTFEIPAAFDGTVTIEASGFERYDKPWNDASPPSEIVLKPLPVSATVNVTGSETRIDQTAASVIALNRRALDATGAATVDDK